MSTQRRMSFFLATLFLGWLVMAPALAAEGLPDFTALVEKASPAVVSVLTFEGQDKSKQLVPDDMMADLAQTPLMEELKKMWGDDLEKKLYGEEEPGLGSGTLVSSDGYIITNYHVVANSQKIYVQLKDRSDYEATLIGYDEGTDLALIKIPAKNVPFLILSNKPVEVGQWVVAIGAPFGFEDSLTAGVVSAKRRNLGTEKYVPFIQTDVAINPGNSGGPLLNLDGDVVGVNSQIVSQSGGYSGLSFSVPAPVVSSVIEQIKAKGYVERGWLGLAFQDLSRDLAKSFGISPAKGALVSKVLPDSPASEAGLEIGDVLISMNEKDIRKASDIPPIVGLLPIGSKIKIGLIRNQKLVTTSLTLTRSPGRAAIESSSLSFAFFNRKHTQEEERGIKVRSLDPERDEVDAHTTQGVVVTSLDNFSWRTSGLRAGDIIIRINGEPIKNPDHFYKSIDNIPKAKTFSLLIARKGEIQRFIAVNHP